jgi:hypothetical protein
VRASRRGAVVLVQESAESVAAFDGRRWVMLVRALGLPLVDLAGIEAQSCRRIVVPERGCLLPARWTRIMSLNARPWSKSTCCARRSFSESSRRIERSELRRRATF